MLVQGEEFKLFNIALGGKVIDENLELKVKQKISQVATHLEDGREIIDEMDELGCQGGATSQSFPSLIPISSASQVTTSKHKPKQSMQQIASIFKKGYS